MERAGWNVGAISEAVVFLDYFKDLPDGRQPGKVIYPLAEVLLLCLLAVLAGAETFVDIARFGEKKLDLLRRFRPFRDGTPSHDHLGDLCKFACNNDPLRGDFRIQFRPLLTCCVSVLPFGPAGPGRALGDDWRGQDRRDTTRLF